MSVVVAVIFPPWYTPAIHGAPRMAEDPSLLYTDEFGHCLFERALRAFYDWLECIPYISCDGDATKSETHRELARNVWRAVQQFCIRLEANDKGELASRIEQAYRDVEDCARIIDNYCTSDKFDFHLWEFGDPAQDHIQPVKGDSAALLEQACLEAQPTEDEDIRHWADDCEWAQDLGVRCEQFEIEKYGHAVTSDYTCQVAYWAWACFWLAVQLKRQKVDHVKARVSLEECLSSMLVVSETKEPVIHEALGRAYGMHIYPFPPLKAEEISAALDRFVDVMIEAKTSLVPYQGSIDILDLLPLDAGLGDPPWQSLAEIENQIGRLAPTDRSILLLGDTGTGKEFYAKKIHKTSNRKDAPFVVVNCPTLPKDRIDAELFGYVRGAFTGAYEDYPGRIRQAAGGTVFLDEIGDLPADCWANLFRFLQAKEINPLKGGTTTVDVRILAATNKPNRIPTEALHRFNHVLRLPPLRERNGDIPSLAKAFFDSAAEAAGRTSLRFPQAEQEKLSQANYEWPGNIRQLEMAIQRAIALHEPGRELSAQEVLDAAKAAENPT
jgi:hypothetical protein